MPLSQQDIDDLLEATDSISWRTSSPVRKRSRGTPTLLFNSLHSSHTPKAAGVGTPASAARTVSGLSCCRLSPSMCNAVRTVL